MCRKKTWPKRVISNIQSQSQLLKVINLPSLKFQMDVKYPTHIQALGVTVYK